MQAPTGFGKSQVSVFMANGAASRGKTTAFVVPRQELAYQFSSALNEYAIPHSFISSGRPFYNRHQVHVCTAGSLINKLHWINPDMLICDEVHYGSGQMDKIIKHYKGLGKTIIGLSATPSRLDGRGLGCWFDDMIEGPTTRWLMDNKYLSEYEYFRADAPDMSGIKKSMGDYAKGQLSEKMENDKVLMGNAATTYKQHAMGKLNVGFCVSRKHAELAAEEFRKQGVPCVAVDGTMDVAKRREIFKAFAKRELLAVMSVELLTFGFDLELAAGMPVTVESMSDMAPTLSVAKQLQKMGRVLRRKSEPAFIFDHANNYTRHGLPDDDREWTLLDKPKKVKADKIRAEVVRMDFRLCPKCGASNDLSAYKCKDCGADLPRMERTIEEVEAELKKITAQDKESMRKQFKQEQASTRDLDGLIELGKRRGYKNPYGWAQYILKARERKRG